MIHTPTGKHIIFDVWMDEFYPDIDQIIEKALNDEKYNIVGVIEKEFKGDGLTKVWILAESHCSIHTYPEWNYISVDLYTCDDEKDVHVFYRKVLEEILNKGIMINKINATVINRGQY